MSGNCSRIRNDSWRVSTTWACWEENLNHIQIIEPHAVEGLKWLLESTVPNIPTGLRSDKILFSYLNENISV